MSCCGKNNYGCAFDPDDEGPSEADIARFGSDDIECPECQTLMHHDAPLCQSCGYAISENEAAGVKANKQLLIGGIAVVTIAAFVLVSVL